MKTLSLSLGVLLMFLGFASSHSASVESRTDEESIKGAYKAYVKAWKTKDLAALKGLISPDYMAVNFEGTLSSKENELATAKSDLDWDTMTVDEIHTRAWRDAAIASGSSPRRGKNLTGAQLTLGYGF